jgi:hypothetical protein
MAQKNSKLIAISTQNYEVLSKLGTLSDSFDSVVTKVLEAAVPILEKERRN